MLPNFTANGCLKRHERFKREEDKADDWDGAEIEISAKAYEEVREQMWNLFADREGEKLQTVEAKFHINTLVEAAVLMTVTLARKTSSYFKSNYSHQASMMPGSVLDLSCLPAAN